MKEDREELLISATLIILFIAVIIGAYVRTRTTEPVDDTGSSTPISALPIVTPPDNNPSQEIEPPKQVNPDRQVVLDDRVTIKFTSDEYLTEADADSDFGLSLWEKMGSMPVNEYSFSGGFLMIPSTNLTPSFTDGTYGMIECATSGFKIGIRERDPAAVSVDDLAKEVFSNSGFYDYGQKIECGVPKNAKLELGVGLADWEDRFKGLMFRSDPTMSGNMQVVADYIDECSYGETRYICLYNGDRFTAHAFVTCDGGRILEIEVTGNIMNLCWSYVLEVTNNSIKMIE